MRQRRHGAIQGPTRGVLRVNLVQEAVRDDLEVVRDPRAVHAVVHVRGKIREKARMKRGGIFVYFLAF